MRAVFVDRDGTLMVDPVYARSPDQVRLLPGAAEGLRMLEEKGFSIVIVTNQSGLARGYFDEHNLAAVNARLRDELRARGAAFRALYYCPHHPEEDCSCRKPRPGLLLRAADELNLDLSASFTIGDRGWDIEAGKAAGTRTVLISDNAMDDDGSKRADFIAKNLVEAARLILAGDPIDRRDPARRS